MTLECKLCGDKGASMVTLGVKFGDLGKGPVKVPLCLGCKIKFEKEKVENVVTN